MTGDENNDPLAGIEETMGEVFDDIEAAEAEADDAAAAAAAPEPTDGKDKDEQDADDDDGAAKRDPETGRFLSKKQEGSEDAPPADQKAKEQKDKDAEPAKEKEAGKGEAKPSEKEGEDEGEAPPPKPPDRWSADDKKAFESLPREAQTLVLKREADVERHLHKESQAIADQRRHYDTLETVIGPRRQQLAGFGFTDDAQAIDTLFKHSDFAARDPAGYVQWFAQHRGLDLAELAETQTYGGQGDGAPDPALTHLSSRIENLETSYQKAVQAEAVAEYQQAEQTVEQFAAATDDAGNLKHPHLDTVRDMMVTLIAKAAESGGTLGLDDAYDQAVWAHPETRGAMLETTRKSSTEKAKEAAVRARKAAGTTVRQRGAPSGGSKPPGSMDETLEDAYDAAVGRG
jgi:hypothetical protein